MWRQSIPDWFPFACLITGRMVVKPIFTRIVEGILIGAVGAGFALAVSFRVLERDVAELKVDLKVHEKLNEDYRNRMLTEKHIDDSKWDARITRLENCFIRRDCK